MTCLTSPPRERDEALGRERRLARGEAVEQGAEGVLGLGRGRRGSRRSRRRRAGRGGPWRFLSVRWSPVSPAKQDRICPLLAGRLAGMAETTERVLRLLGLLQQRPVWTGPELAERLGVTTRSIRRDVERLRALGYPVHATQGVGGGYQLGRGRGAPAAAARRRRGGRGRGLAADGRRRHRLGRERGGAADAGQARPGDAAAAARRGARDPRGDPDPRLRARPPSTATPCCGSPGRCRDTVRVRFDYESRDKTPSARTVEPVGLVATGRRWYLMAYDVDRDDWRTFRLDRMTRGRADDLAVPRARARGPRGVRPAGRGQRGVPLPGADRRARAPLTEVAERTSVRSVVLTAIDERHDAARGGRRDAVRPGVPPVVPGLGVRGAGAGRAAYRSGGDGRPGDPGRGRHRRVLIAT